jgi:ABC-type multidrug transport system permease subunit
MRSILLMVRKDLLRQLRAPMAILLMLAFPLVFTSLLALTFGSGAQPSMPKVQLLVEDLDGSFVSGALVSAVTSEQMGKYFDVEQVGAGGLERIEQNKASALWRLPKGLQQDLIDGTPVELELIRNPAQSILPEIAEQGLTVLAELMSAAARVLEEPLDELRPMLDEESAPGAARVSALSVMIYEIVNRAEGILNPPAIVLDTVQLEDDEDETGSGGGSTISLIFLIVLPGISVWGLFLVGDMAMRDIIGESTRGTLRRQLAGPIRPGQLLVAKSLYTAAVSSISLVLLAGIGWGVARQTIDPVGFVVLSLALILAITGYASLVYGGAGTERQGATISSVLLLIFAFVGGSFIQVESLPGAVQRVAPISPFYWGTSGYQTLIRDDGGLIDILPNVGVLATIGVVLLAAGAMLLQRKMRGGAA